MKGTFFTLQEAALYLGSKGAVEQFVRVLSRELSPRNVTVNTLSPSCTNTDMNDMIPDDYRDVATRMSPFGRIGQPADVAVFLASDEARWVTGQNIAACGGVF